MLGTILLWHYRPRHRFILKSEKALEKRNLITLDLIIVALIHLQRWGRRP